MDLSVFQPGNPLDKRILKLKKPKKDGLLLRLHYTSKHKKIRFSTVSLSNSASILAAADGFGNVCILDFIEEKFWVLPSFPTSLVALEEVSGDKIFFALPNGDISSVDLYSGTIINKLKGHKKQVKSFSFSNEGLMLTCSESETILWDLSKGVKLKILNVKPNSAIKFALFIPVTNNILGCFSDNLIQIWDKKSFKELRQTKIQQSLIIKHLTFSLNGKILLISYQIPIISFYKTSSLSLFKQISLTDSLISIKQVEFVPQSFDGGCHKFLSILSGQGLIQFYSIEQNQLVAERKESSDITKFTIKSDLAACVLSCGEIVVLYLENILQDNEIKTQRVPNKLILKKPKSVDYRNQIEDILELDKLKRILKEFNCYPDCYRSKIWEKLLQLPCNVQQYESVINQWTRVSFEDLDKNYPLESKVEILSLRRLLDNVVTWCPFFAQVPYLPVFVFPFVKVLRNQPLVLFEAVCTILINWCQYWFEYFPLPPANILAMTENLLIEHDPELLKYFSKTQIKPITYAWPLLETAFSEVLSAKDWLSFWDHVFSNDPSFLLCATVAFNIVNSTTIRSLRLTDLTQFYHNQFPLDFKKFLSKTYKILERTSESIQPQRYLRPFKPLGKVYSVFKDYPKTLLEFQVRESESLNQQLTELKSSEEDILSQKKSELKMILDVERRNEEDSRLREVEKACLEKVIEKQQKVEEQYKHLEELRKSLMIQEQEILEMTKQKLKERAKQREQSSVDFLMRAVELGRFSDLQTFYKAQDGLLRRYSEGLREKIALKSGSSDSEVDIVNTLKSLHNLIGEIEAEIEDKDKFSDLRIGELRNESVKIQKGITQVFDFLSSIKSSRN